MKRPILILLAAAALEAQAAPAVPGAQPAVSDRMQWFREEKFGMFIHFGPYSNLAGEWDGRQLAPGRNAEWIMHELQIPVARYRELARQFNPAKYDAESIARLARSTGMKYLVLTAKHHDGFAMYHSKASPYNLVEWTPFHRDAVREMAEACRKEGIRFCVYYSHREDWDDPDAYGNTWDYKPEQQNFEAYLERKSKPQLRELLTGYGPLGMVWFDRGLYTAKQAQEFIDMVRSAQPECLINGRVGGYEQELMGDFQELSDNGMPPGGLNEYWESPQTLNDTWGYSRFDHNWKKPETVIRRLVEIVSKGGNYLLNIGPMGDGSVPQPTVEILTRVGEWVRQNGESVYGTSACPLGGLRWGTCTVKGSRLYLHVFDWPRDGVLRIAGLRNATRSAHLLSAPGQALETGKTAAGLQVRLPAAAPDPVDAVVVLELEGAPRVDPPVVVQQGASPLRLDYMTAVTSGATRKRFNRRGGFHISRWMAPADRAAWRVRVATPGRYAVKIRYAAQPEWQGGKYQVAVGARTLRGTVDSSPGWYEYRAFEVGAVEVPKAGEVAVSIGPAAETDHDLMYFESLELTRAK